MSFKLKEMCIGQKAKILGFESCPPAYRMKLLSMGLTHGVEFTLEKIAPLGDPVEISLRGYSLSLRKGEADVLKIEKSGGSHANCDCG